MKTLLFAGLLSLPLVTVSPIAAAASDAECAIWLCLPTGFPSGCGDAKSAFKKRIKKLKSPLPNFASCIVKGSSPTSQIHAGDGYAAYIPETNTCTRREMRRVGKDWESQCVEYQAIPARVEKGRHCIIQRNKGEETYRRPKGCTRTVRYVDTFLDGKPYGETYYFDNSGNEVVVPK